MKATNYLLQSVFSDGCSRRKNRHYWRSDLKTKTNRTILEALIAAYNGGFEFKDGVKQTNEYAYAANGNLTKDLHKNIRSIQYNCLNLPSVVTFADGSTITYTYAANGTKLRTAHKISNTTTTTDYCGNVVYENGTPKYLLTEEGYVTLVDKKYHYFLKDHQGNNRVVVDAAGTVEEVNHHYPFGGLFASSGKAQPYKYNGKEYDDQNGVNWYDYGARMYDAATGRFTTQDRFAEKYYAMSPYQHGANNPVKNVDVNGDSIWFTNKYVNKQLTGVTMHLTGKVFNDSREQIDLNTVSNNISTAIKRTYNGQVDNISFDTDVQLSIAANMDAVDETDHLFVLTDKITEIKGGKIYGASNYIGGKVAFIGASLFSGIYDEMLGSRNYGSFTAAHEFGHLIGLEHDKSPFNVMRSNGKFYNIKKTQLRRIYNM